MGPEIINARTGRNKDKGHIPGGKIVRNTAKGWYVETPTGETVIVGNLHEAVKDLSRKRKETINQAVRALTPIIFQVEGGQGVDEQSFSVKLTEIASKSRFYRPDDWQETFRLACAAMGKEGVSAEKGAELIINSLKDPVVSLGLGSIPKIAFEMGRERLKEELTKYYPANFPANKAFPRK